MAEPAASVEEENPIKSSRSRIVEVGTSAFMATIASYAVGLVAAVLIARALGPSGRGAYYLPVTIATIALYAGSLGTHQSQVRMWSDTRYSRDELVTSGVLLSIGLGCLTLGGTVVVYLATRSGALSDVEPVALGIAVSIVPVQIHSLLVFGALILEGHVVRAHVVRLAGALAQLVGISILVALDHLTVTAVLLLYGVSIVTPWLLMLPSLFTIGRVRRPVPWAAMKQQLGLGIQLLPFILFLYLNLRVDVLFIARYEGVSAVGIYSVAVVLSELMWLATDSLVASTSERQATASDIEAVAVTLRAVRMSLLLAALVGGSIGLAAPVLIPVLYGNQFTDATAVVWWLVVAAGGMAVWKAVSVPVIRFAKSWLQPLIAVAAVAVNILGNIVFVPRFGIGGAAAASVLSYWLAAVLALGWLVRAGGASAHGFVPTRSDLRQLAEIPGLVFKRLDVRPGRRATDEISQIPT